MIKIVIVSLLLAASLAAPKLTTTGIKGMVANADLKVTMLPTYLSQVSDKVLLPVSQQGPSNSPVCKAVWGSDGTICSPKKMLKYTEKENTVKPSIASMLLSSSLEMKSVIMSHSLATGKLGLMGKSGANPTSSLLSKLSSKASSRFLKATLQSSKFPALSSAISPNTIAEVHLSLAMIQPLVSFDMAKFIGNMKTCWGYLNHARNVAMCYACSQHNNKYFSQGKAIVTQQDCGNMLKSCLPFFSGVTFYATNAHRILDTEGKSNWNSHQLATLKSLYQAMVAATLPEKISLYGTSTGTIKTGCGNSLCLRLFRLYKSPIFDIVGNMVNSVTKEIKKSPIGEAPRALLGNSNQSSGDLTDLFSGDVAILSSGPDGSPFLQFSDASSVPVGIDASINAMNLTLAFP